MARKKTSFLLPHSNWILLGFGLFLLALVIWALGGVSGSLLRTSAPTGGSCGPVSTSFPGGTVTGASSGPTQAAAETYARQNAVAKAQCYSLAAYKPTLNSLCSAQTTSTGACQLAGGSTCNVDLAAINCTGTAEERFTDEGRSLGWFADATCTYSCECDARCEPVPTPTPTSTVITPRPATPTPTLTVTRCNFNGTCEAYLSEDIASCATDCRCDNDGLCEINFGENNYICPNDCPGYPMPHPLPTPWRANVCGNGICEWQVGEWFNCSVDCRPTTTPFVPGF